MNCPVCDEKLREIERHGVTVDICPGCKGVWLDRGELDKILELTQGEGLPAAQADAPVVVSPQQVQAAPPPQQYQAAPPQYERPHRDDDDDDDHDRRQYARDDPRYREGRRKKGGILGDILGMFEGGGD